MSCIYTFLAAAHYLKAQRQGRIVTVASTGGGAQGSYFPYGLAKAVIIYYTRTLAQELDPLLH